MNKQKNVMLTITEKCNLKCSYCFEANKSYKSMSFDTAKKIIEQEMNLNDNFDDILFDFMGGEPFVEFTLIREICEYVWFRNWPKKYLFFASTNGTLFNDEIKEWLVSNKERFVCGLSLDGTPEMHNKNRCNSFNKIDTDFFVKAWPLQEAKMTVSPDTISELFAGVSFIHSLGFRVKSNLAYGPDWSKKGIKETYIAQLNKLIDYYITNNNLEPTTLLNMDIIPAAYPKEPLRKWCGMGSQMIAYDINGIKYPCHFFQDMSFSSEQKDNLWSIDYDTIHTVASNKCSNCILKNSCPTCYGYNYSKYGDYVKKDPAMCELKRISAIATSTLKYRRLVSKYNNDLTKISDEEKEVVKAVFTIQHAADTGNWNTL